MGAMQDHSDVIEAFGGVRPLAEAIGIKPALATHWPRRGIPAKYWQDVEDAAVERQLFDVTVRALRRLSTIQIRTVA